MAWKKHAVEWLSGIKTAGFRLAQHCYKYLQLSFKGFLLAAMFFLECANANLWAVAMDLGGDHFAGTVSGFMNTGQGVAGMISPIVCGLAAQEFVVFSLLLRLAVTKPTKPAQLYPKPGGPKNWLDWGALLRYKTSES